jgi:hypothetical protein
MKLKIKHGRELVFSTDNSFELVVYKNELMVNLNNRWTYKSFEQHKNQLVIETTQGTIVGIFTGEVPKLEFQYQEKDQLVFYVILTNDLHVSK